MFMTMCAQSEQIMVNLNINSKCFAIVLSHMKCSLEDRRISAARTQARCDRVQTQCNFHDLVPCAAAFDQSLTCLFRSVDTILSSMSKQPNECQCLITEINNVSNTKSHSESHLRMLHWEPARPVPSFLQSHSFLVNVVRNLNLARKP